MRNSNGKDERIVPDAKSWSEFHSQTVPHPRIWKVPFTGCGVATAGGGVTTSNIPVHSGRSTTDDKIAARVAARKKSDKKVTKVPSGVANRVIRPTGNVDVKTW